MWSDLKKSHFKYISSLKSNLMSRATKNIYDKCQKILKPRSDAQNTFGLPKYTLKKDMKHYTFKLVHSHLEKKLASFRKEVEK